MKRYKKVLREFKRRKNLRSSYAAVGADRNTVVASAASAELAIVSQAKYEEHRHSHSRGQKLKIFIMKCSDALSNDPALLSEVEHLRKNGKLLPIIKEKVKCGMKCSLRAAVFQFLL